MSRFLKYIFFVLCGFAILDVSSRFIFGYFFEHPGKDSRIEAVYKFVFHENPDNLVILGASRADRHYASQQIEDSLKISLFNYGFEGCSIVHQYLSLLKAIENGGLKLVILDLSTAQLEEEWVHDRNSRYYPYYWKNDTIKNVINKVEGKNMSFYMLSSLFQYNSQLFNLFIKDKQYKGYSPLPFKNSAVEKIVSDKDPLVEYKEIEHSVSPLANAYLGEMKKECEIHNIKFVVCISPSFVISEGNDRYIENLCKNINIDCWNMSTTVEIPTFFSDETHLNEKGAELFTGFLIKKIKTEGLF